MAEKDALATFFNASARQPWDKKLTGIALSLPKAYRQYMLKGELYIEYLQTGSTNRKQGDTPQKNHVVFQIPFADSGYELLDDDGKNFRARGARVSMDLTEEVDLLEEIDEDRLEDEYIGKELCVDYYPGTLYLKLLKYDEKSMAANKITKFDDLAFDTLGEFVDFLADNNLHMMSFLGYGDAWKGCRDFIAQTFLQLRRGGKVAEVDQGKETLMETIMKVHHKEGSHDKLIDRGKFLVYLPVYPDSIKEAYEPEPVEEESVEPDTVEA